MRQVNKDWFCSQKYLAGIHYPTCRWKRKNFVTTSAFISGSGHSNQCLCSTSLIPRRSKGQILWRTGHRHQGNPWEKAAVHSRRAKRQSWWRSKPRLLSSFRYYPSLCLLELCCHHSPCIGNTLFNTKPEHWIGDTQDLSTGTSLTWSSADAPVFQASRSGVVFRVLIAIRPDSPLVCSKVKPRTR